MTPTQEVTAVRGSALVQGSPSITPQGFWCREQEQLAFEHWMEKMAEGSFEEAWRIDDARGRHWPSAHRLFAGSNLHEAIKGARVSIRSLHGLGDAVQMLRYAPELSSLASSVEYRVQDELLALMPYFRGVEDGWNREAKNSRGDVSIELTELPYLFRTQLAELPLADCYLSLPSSLSNRMAASMGSGRRPRVGVVWSGGDWDRERWVPFARLKALLRDDRFEWWNLQGAPMSRAAHDISMRTAPDLREGGLVTLAATIANLDLVLTIDSLAAHLAGAMGVPAWVMLKHEADWRWMRGRSDSPWYRSVRLFRQASPGDWSGVVSAVHAELQGV